MVMAANVNWLEFVETTVHGLETVFNVLDKFPFLKYLAVGKAQILYATTEGGDDAWGTTGIARINDGCHIVFAGPQGYEKEDLNFMSIVTVVMEKKPIRCVFVGYDSDRKGWRCCNASTRKIHVSRNVNFDKNSSWRSIENQVLSNSNQLREELEASRINLVFDKSDSVNTEDEETVHPSEESIELETQLRRS
ncbi:hypothetical protein E3N88_19769 [Mikania micrantha]|uniref:Retroviral polymerase SH3-like domain-containing protein n=1 Tax=Mikania micrantha TaxID=192012 RepID=A0A5N6NR38_9ASTR|nr:hypothetical protein E3N88_19769 [Mikania micrantha]